MKSKRDFRKNVFISASTGSQVKNDPSTIGITTGNEHEITDGFSRGYVIGKGKNDTHLTT